MVRYKPLPQTERLWELFDYSPLTGHLYHRRDVELAGVTKGDVVGYIAHTRHNEIARMTKVDGQNYHTNRLIWKWCNGKDPEYQVDHINRNRLDERIHNLRDINNSNNQINRDAYGAIKHKLIAYRPKQKRQYQFMFQRKGFRCHKRTFFTLAEALKYRDEYLTMIEQPLN
mgnify:CR=1 FL=1